MQSIKFKAGDEFTLGATIDIGRDDQLTDCTVLMRLRNAETSGITEYSPTILSETAGTVQYKFLPGETETAGVYWVEFWITLPDGTVRKAPSEDWLNIIILDDIN